MEKENLLNQLEEKFKEIRNELKFKSTLEQLDKIFFIKDYILEKGYVSDSLSRRICVRICDVYYSWMEHLHSLLFPTPGNLLAMTESKCFNEEEKKKIFNLIKRTMSLISKYRISELTKDKKAKSKFIDESVKFWNDEFKPQLITIMKKINEKWRE